ncbi:hypothetical protein RY831_02575 [Noviherbaspirillum sp. CPCC 100848]|uniref:Uncharacterized protein n=1 Tax=Noviherbaspirillum album TaxID=3080276 RepID=A0ABU6J331_9BURK|nr:hypothetical protein [Noviherbaspirillum sp. CPCC 100848]MEC4718022.1 hypothetical protein [Noviherbaspirillum sp. CPCC 100848]
MIQRNNTGSESNIRCVVPNLPGVSDMPNPQGARTLIYTVRSSRGTSMRASLHINESNMLYRMVWEPESAVLNNPLRREADFLPASHRRPASPPRRHFGQINDLTMLPREHLGSRRRRSDTGSPPEAPPPQRPRITGAMPQGAAVAGPAPLPQEMEHMHQFRQTGIQVIERDRFQRSESAPPAYYRGLTVEAGYRDANQRLHYYLERQTEQSCAQHAVNAMLGGPLVLFEQFVQYELDQPLPTAARSEAEIRADIDRRGVEAETVLGVLHAEGIPAASYRHMPAVNNAGEPIVNWEHLAQIDELDTDRLLMHASTAVHDPETGNMYALDTHFVAFRRESATGQWLLLDSMRGAPEAITPLQYLWNQNGEANLLNEVTVIMPSQRLRLSAGTAAGEGVAGGATGGRRGGTVTQDHHTQHAGPSSGAVAVRPEREAMTVPRFQVIRTTVNNYAHYGKTYQLAFSTTDNPNHAIYKHYSVRNFNSEAEAQAAMAEDIKSIEDGAFVASVERKRREHLENYPEISLLGGRKGQADSYYKIKIRSIPGLEGLSRTFPIKKYGSSDNAKQAAIEALEDIRSNPGKYSKKVKAERQSIVRCVTYRASANCWTVALTQGPDKKRVHRNFSITLENAQAEAERYALNNGLRPVVRGPRDFAPGLSGVPPISWNSEQEAFRVNHGEETQAFAHAEFGNDLLAARTAAENHAVTIAESLKEQEPTLKWLPINQ